jgi:hypothetical protein
MVWKMNNEINVAMLEAMWPGIENDDAAFRAFCFACDVKESEGRAIISAATAAEARKAHATNPRRLIVDHHADYAECLFRDNKATRFAVIIQMITAESNRVRQKMNLCVECRSPVVPKLDTRQAGALGQGAWYNVKCPCCSARYDVWKCDELAKPHLLD